MSTRTKFTWNYADGFWYGPDLDPDEELDYLLECEDLLDGDTISSVQTSASNVTVSSSSYTGPNITLWLTSGTVNTVATISVLVTTSGGRTFERSFKIQVKQL